MPALNVGSTNVKVSASDFQPQVKVNLMLNVAAHVREDFQMQVGSASQTREVEADSIQVQNDTSK